MKIKNTTKERYMAWRERTGRGEFFTINHMPYHYTEIDMMLGLESADSKTINIQEESHEELEGIFVARIDELADPGDSESTE